MLRLLTTPDGAVKLSPPFATVGDGSIPMGPVELGECTSETSHITTPTNSDAAKEGVWKITFHVYVHLLDGMSYDFGAKAERVDLPTLEKNKYLWRVNSVGIKLYRRQTIQ